MQGDAVQTEVIWSMFGKNNFMMKAMGMFMDCDKMIGSDFEKGLANLKSLAETTAKQPANECTFNYDEVKITDTGEKS